MRDGGLGDRVEPFEEDAEVRVEPVATIEIELARFRRRLRPRLPLLLVRWLVGWMVGWLDSD